MKHRRIPTLLGIALLVGVLFVFNIAFNRITPLLSRAGHTAEPIHVTFSNISDTSFTVTWLTKTSATGAVIVYGKTLITAYDQRDETNALSNNMPVLGSYTEHSVIVRNANPDTTYNIRILSNGIPYQKGTSSYTVSTGPVIPKLEEKVMEPAYGSVALADGSPAAGSIVYVQLEGGQMLSGMATETGSWVIPLHITRSHDLSRYIPYDERIVESITIRSIHGESTAITDTLNDNPVPSMKIGKTYDYRNIQAQTSIVPKQPTPAITPDPALSPAVLGQQTARTTQLVSITQPDDGARLTTNVPLFQGTGVVGNQVSIIVGIQHIQTGNVIVGKDGLWRFTPKHPLSEGKQSITITTVDKLKKTVTRTHTFTILKSGTQVLGDATPSATLTPTDIVTPEPTEDLTGEPIPETGSGLPTIILTLSGFLFVAGGMIMFLL